MWNSIQIGDTVIGPGENRKVLLNLGRLPTHTSLELPVFVFRAAAPGPTLLLTAGLHGDEINGVEVLRRLIHNQRLSPTAGTVVAIPVVNVFGFIHTSRTMPDGKDLNRSFPGSSRGSLASRIAHLLMSEVLPHVDLGVDFHTGGASKSNYPHLRCHLDGANIQEAALGFAPPFIVNSRPPDHSFRKAAAQNGVPILTFEGGESLRLDSLAIQEGIDGIRRLMRHLGMRKSSVANGSPRILRGSWWNRARHSGVFRSRVAIGDRIQARQVLGHIADPFGEVEYAIKARGDGYVIGLNHLCVVSTGEALIHVGSENQPPAVEPVAGIT